MKKDITYQHLLNKMLIIESAGNILYKALISKIKDEKLRLIYERLAYNEQETAEIIEKEILKINKMRSMAINNTILNSTKLICGILTIRQLTWILKSALKKRICSKWYAIHKDENQDFWNALLKHEDLQHQLLKPFWDN